MIVSYLPNPESHPLWNGIRELLKPACEDEVLSPGEIVWIAYDGPTLFGAGTTALAEDERTAVIVACGGHRHREWVHEALRIVEAWARDAGASRLTMRGRRGWARYVRALGWDATGTEGNKQIYEKDLARG